MALGLADQGATVVLHGSSPHNLEAARAALLQARLGLGIGLGLGLGLGLGWGQGQG